MSSRSQEYLARQWAEETRDNFMSSSELEEAAAKYILEHTAPPTMADVEWDDEKHYLAGATDGDGDAVVMCGENADGEINVIVSWDHHTFSTPKDQLTPNGKRYRMVEKPGHPEVLETVEDYENAPLGTVVEGRSILPWCKHETDWWEHAFDGSDDKKMPTYAGKTRVLRWGGEA